MAASSTTSAMTTTTGGRGASILVARCAAAPWLLCHVREFRLLGIRLGAHQAQDVWTCKVYWYRVLIPRHFQAGHLLPGGFNALGQCSGVICKLQCSFASLADNSEPFDNSTDPRVSRRPAGGHSSPGSVEGHRLDHQFDGSSRVADNSCTCLPSQVPLRRLGCYASSLGRKQNKSGSQGRH